jgi:hypothetical protein
MPIVKFFEDKVLSIFLNLKAKFARNGPNFGKHNILKFGRFGFYTYNQVNSFMLS